MELMEASDKLNELFHIADKVAQRLAREYYTVELEDIEQHLKLHAIEYQDSIRLFEEDTPPSNPAAIFYKVGKRYCGNEVAASSWNVANTEYSTDEVRRQLEDCLVFQELINTYVPESSKSHRPKLNRSANAAPMAEWDSVYIGVEVREHMRYLSEEDRTVLFRRYVLDDEEFKTNSTLRNRLRAAVKRLTHELNSFKQGRSKWQQERSSGWTGSREFVSRVTPEL